MRLRLAVCHQALLISAQNGAPQIDVHAIAHSARQQNLDD
jgi:hypothetical protein